MQNLWIEVGNSCLQKAWELLQHETTLTEETVGIIKELVNIAIALDQEDLAWGGHRNVFFPSNSKASAKDRQELANSIQKILIEQSKSGQN